MTEETKRIEWGHVKPGDVVYNVITSYGEAIRDEPYASLKEAKEAAERSVSGNDEEHVVIIKCLVVAVGKEQPGVKWEETQDLQL